MPWSIIAFFLSKDHFIFTGQESQFFVRIRLPCPKLVLRFFINGFTFDVYIFKMLMLSFHVAGNRVWRKGFILEFEGLKLSSLGAVWLVRVVVVFLFYF